MGVINTNPVEDVPHARTIVLQPNFNALNGRAVFKQSLPVCLRRRCVVELQEGVKSGEALETHLRPAHQSCAQALTLRLVTGKQCGDVTKDPALYLGPGCRQRRRTPELVHRGRLFRCLAVQMTKQWTWASQQQGSWPHEALLHLVGRKRVQVGRVHSGPGLPLGQPWRPRCLGHHGCAGPKSDIQNFERTLNGPARDHHPCSEKCLLRPRSSHLPAISDKPLAHSN